MTQTSFQGANVDSHQWKVRIAGRVETVSDDARFPTLFEDALKSNPDVTLVRFQQHPWPHANSADIVIFAIDKKEAEAKGHDIMKQILKLAADSFGVARYGWTVSAGAELMSGGGQA
jgi:hypothetical protein